MLLAFSFEEPLATLAVDPPFQAIQLRHGRFVDLFELVMRGGRLVQDAAELRHTTLTLSGFVKSSQQEPLALGEIIRKSASVVHNARNSTNAT
jgi:hypothetical protein